MYYYFPEGFPVKVKTQRAWRKQHFFGKSTFWVSTFLPLLSAELWTHVGVRKQYSTIASPNQSVSNESSFASHSICDEKILRRTLKGKRKRHEDLFAPQSNWASFSLHRGTKFILTNAHLQFRRREYAVLDFSMQMSPFHELGFGKKKEFDERIRLNHSWCKRKYFYFIKEEWRACIY